MSASIVIASFERITSGGCHRDTVTATQKEETVKLVARSMRWPIRLASAQKDTGDTTQRQCKTQRKSSKHMQLPLGLCDNSVNALKLLATQQKDGDRPTESIVTGLREKSRKGNMDGLRNFIEVDNHSAVGVGGLRRGTKSIQVKKSQFSVAFPEAVIREGADELTLRAEEVVGQNGEGGQDHSEQVRNAEFHR